MLTVTAGGGIDAEGRETLDIDYAGPPMRVLFNPSYLLDGLTGMGPVATRLTFSTDDPQVATVKPVVLAAADTDSPDFRYLIMPIKPPDSGPTPPS